MSSKINNVFYRLRRNSINNCHLLDIDQTNLFLVQYHNFNVLKNNWKENVRIFLLLTFCHLVRKFRFCLIACLSVLWFSYVFLDFYGVKLSGVKDKCSMQHTEKKNRQSLILVFPLPRVLFFYILNIYIKKSKGCSSIIDFCNYKSMFKDNLELI